MVMPHQRERIIFKPEVVNVGAGITFVGVGMTNFAPGC